MAKAPVILVGLVLAALVGAAVASAASPPPPVPPDPAIAQYVEVVPTSAGPAVPAPAGRGPASLPRNLTPRVVREVASSPRYGAPQRRLHASPRVAAAEQRAVEKPAGALSAPALGAAVDAVGAGHGIVFWLGLVLLVTTAVGVGAAVTRVRR